VEAATQSGVIVCNTPDYCITEVAEHAMALVLALARRLFPLARNARAGRWDYSESGEFDRHTMQRLPGQSLGLIGFGRIGRAVAERAHAFGLQIRRGIQLQALGWRDGGCYLPLQDDIASVAFWYQTLPTAPFPALPDKDALEVI